MQLVKSSPAQQKLMPMLAYSSQQSSYSAAASMPLGLLVSYTASLSRGFEQSAAFLRSFEPSDGEERRGDASGRAHQQPTPGALDAQCVGLQAYKRAHAPKEILLNSYFYSRTSSQSYDTPFSSMPISSS